MKTLIMLLAVCSMIACKNKENKSECEDVMCTEVFAMITVEIKVPSGTDMSQFSSKTLLKSNNQLIHQQESIDSNFMNSFTVVDDSHLKTIGYNKEIEVVFQLFKDGDLQESHPFTIKTDCCHVEKKSGVRVIEVE
jgi:hypothetical protein